MPNSNEERTYYVICEDNCKFPSMTKEQILAAIAEATGVAPESIDIDAAFITKIKEQNANKNLKFWIGTTAQFIALPTKQPDTIYIFTDDDTLGSVEQLVNDISELQESIDKIISGETPVENANNATNAENATKVNNLEIAKDDNGIMYLKGTSRTLSIELGGVQREAEGTAYLEILNPSGLYDGLQVVYNEETATVDYDGTDFEIRVNVNGEFYNKQNTTITVDTINTEIIIPQKRLLYSGNTVLSKTDKVILTENVFNKWLEIAIKIKIQYVINLTPVYGISFEKIKIKLGAPTSQSETQYIPDFTTRSYRVANDSADTSYKVRFSIEGGLKARIVGDGTQALDHISIVSIHEVIE